MASDLRGRHMRRHVRKYDYFGYVVWFILGAFFGGIPLVLDLMIHSADWSWLTLVEVMAVCGLIGGLIWGRKHRRRWENEYNADELFREVMGLDRNDRD